jgi:heparan-alpha-glucosaminide N-acetyltransferase
MRPEIESLRDSAKAPNAPARLSSIDAYRGFVMFLMLGEVLHLAKVSKTLGEPPFWKFLAHHQEHAAWVGCSLHDLIQPSFSFLVGVAAPFSLASRLARGQSPVVMSLHAVWRALVLVFLGIFLRSMGRDHTNFTFEDTLTQIGLGYVFLFALGFRPVRDQLIALGAILIGYWAAFALYPVAGEPPRSPAFGVPANWPHTLSGFAAHWNKNQNVAWAFDRWFLNLLPRKTPFVANSGGYSTLSFVPTLGTMILGLLAGGVLKSDRPTGRKLAVLVGAGLFCLTAGWAVGELGVCPVVKRIWTPSWVLFSGGWCFLILAGFYLVLDVTGVRFWAFPLVVIGANSIAAYLLSWLAARFVEDSLRTHLGRETFKAMGPAYESLLLGGAVLLVLWLVLLAMYRKSVFVRV